MNLDFNAWVSWLFPYFPSCLAWLFSRVVISKEIYHGMLVLGHLRHLMSSCIIDMFQL